MAKRGYAIETYAAGMFIRQEQYAQRVKHLYEQAVNELLALAAQMPIDVDGEVFSFSDNPRIANETTKIIRRLYSQVYGEIKHGVEAEWKYANLSCDRLIESIFGKQIKETNLGARWFQRNKEAMDQFFKRTQADGGMNLSQRVWKYTGDLRGEMENAISVSMGEGVSAATMSRRVCQYLREPNKLFRRVRGSDGKLHLSKPAQLYHPGQGVYRSSYKNAMRLTRTETNAAYRAADEDRWSRMDFVVGFEVKKSNNHPDTDICDDLCGKYPKGFVFTAWHPQCRCFVVPILATPHEMINLQRIAINGGEDAQFVSSNYVYSVPPQFCEWIKKNEERIRAAKVQPYFIRDNVKQVNKILSAKSIHQAISVASEQFKPMTFVSFEPFSAIIIEKLRELRYVNRQQRLLQSLVDDLDNFNIEHIAPSGARTTIHPLHKTKKKDNWELTKQMAIDLNTEGKSVVFLPEHDELSSADALVTNIAGRIRIVDFKHSTTTSWNSLQKDLAKGFTQANTIVLKLENMDAQGFIDTINYMVRNKMTIGNIVLMNSRGKHIDLLRDALVAGRYKKKVRGFL